MVRLSLPRICMLIVMSVIIIAIYKLTLNIAEGNFNGTCNMTDDYLLKLENLLERVDTVLEKHLLIRVLCYGTLWGQIRISQIFPWSHKAEICIFNEELTKIDEAHFISSFIKNNLNIKYISSDGKYEITDKNEESPFVEVFVFERDDEQNMYKRIGWKRRILPPHCDWTPSLHCFPVHLIQSVLPKRRLGRYAYPVPMGGIELQKYHYADDWWKETKTKNCKL